MKKPWTKAERKELRKRFPNEPSKAIAESMGRSASSIHNHAFLMGLKKSRAYMESPAPHQGGKTPAAIQNQFRPGHKAWNKGLKGWMSGGRSASTRFKKGQKPSHTQPIGSIKIDTEGYSRTKVSSSRKRTLRWKLTHVLLWEKHRGKVPRGKIVVFKNRSRADIRLGNLEVITLRENMERNSVQNYPTPIRKLIQLSGVLSRAINKRKKK